MAALDLAQGAGPAAQCHRRDHRAARRRGGLYLQQDPGARRADGPEHVGPVSGIRQRRAHRHRPIRDYGPAGRQLPADPGPDHRLGAVRRGPQLLQRGRCLADQHPARRVGGHPRRRRLPGRLHHHPAVRAQLLPGHRHLADREPEDKRDLRRDEGLQAEVQGLDPGELPQHDLPRPGRLRHRRGGADVLQHPRVQAFHRQLEPGGAAGRDHPAAKHLPAAAVPERSRGPLAIRPDRPAQDGLDHAPAV